MAITLTCPRCTHEQRIDDDQAGKEVPCKICHHTIQGKPAGGAKNVKSAGKGVSSTAIKADARPAAKGGPKKEGVKKGPPPVQSSKNTGVSAKKPRPPRDEDDDDDDAPKSRGKKEGADSKSSATRNRKSREKASSAGMLWILIGGGVFVLLALMCGGSGVGLFFYLRSDGKKVEPIAQNNDPVNAEPPANPKPPPPVNPNPPPFVNPNPPPFVNPNPPVFPDPPPVVEQPKKKILDPLNPNDIETVLTYLQGADKNDREAALSWLARAEPKHPKRDEVSKILEGMVQEELKTPISFSSYFAAYYRWATKENVATLVTIVETPAGATMTMDRRHKAIQALGKIKDAGTAETLAKRLPDFFDRQATIGALIEIGPAGEPFVLKYFNHPDGQARGAARQVILAYKTSNNVLLTQCLADLDSADQPRKDGALDWFGQTPPDPARRADVARALNKCIENESQFRFNNPLIRALENWGTAENTTQLVVVMEQTKFGAGNIIRLLGKIRDVNSIEPIAKRLSNPSDRFEVQKFLTSWGKVAEPSVAKLMLATPDNQTRTECVRLLGQIGTRGVSVPALQQIAQRFPQDRFFLMTVQTAMFAANNRP